MAHRQNIYYFDNASTSWPKHPAVREALAHFYDHPSGAYGRSRDEGTLRIMAAIETLRDNLARLLGDVDPSKIVLNSGATESVNTILRGFHLEGRTIWVSPLEHNSTMRPFHRLARQFNLNVRIMPSGEDGRIDVSRLRAEARPGTALAIINLVGNVNGVIQPVEELVRIIGGEMGIPILLDASQYLGFRTLPKGLQEVDFIVFSGHKGLLGPTGTGGFYIKAPEKIEPLLVGGNGFQSENFTEIARQMPERFMAGTPNMVGLHALGESVKELPSWKSSPEALQDLFSEIEKDNNYTLYRALEPAAQAPIFSLIHAEISTDTLANRLGYEYAIYTRDGLHCAPMAHEHLHTLPHGTVRFSFSPYHTNDDLAYLLRVLQDVS